MSVSVWRERAWCAACECVSVCVCVWDCGVCV